MPDVVSDSDGEKNGTRRSRSLLTLLPVLFALGCGSADFDTHAQSPAKAGRTEAAHSTYEEHDHTVPTHKPISFPHGVTELVRRHGELREQTASARSGADRATRFQELCDIVGWLPLPAADGDLSETEWMPVRQAVDRIEAAYRVLQPYIDDRKLTPSPELWAAAEREFAALQRTAEQRVEAFEVTPHRTTESSLEPKATACACGHDHHHELKLPSVAATSDRKPTVVTE